MFAIGGRQGGGDTDKAKIGSSIIRMITLEYTSERRMVWSSKYHKLLGQYYKQASDGKKVYTLHIFKNFKFTVTLSTYIGKLCGLVPTLFENV